jgi:hypothetical protein
MSALWTFWLLEAIRVAFPCCLLINQGELFHVGPPLGGVEVMDALVPWISIKAFPFLAPFGPF